jgi:2-keto-4-pentenoate hydratase
LAQQPVGVFVNGMLVREGDGAAVLGHPLNALEWLVNAATERGVGLERGEYVTTGVATEVYMAERGDRATADFGGIGRAEVEFV